jgi:LemA protein
MMGLGLLLVGLVAIGLWIAATYNKLIISKNEALNSWKQIDVQLKRRHDLIPNLVEIVKGAMNFEQSTLTRVIEARNKAVAAGGIPEKAAQENILSGALRQLFALVENYPVLKSNENAAKLQEELANTENKIGTARQFYNDIATQYNIAAQTFPSAVIAGMFGFKQMELFEVNDASEKEAPKVNLDLK